MSNSFSARKELDVNGKSYEYYDLNALPQDKVSRLPQSLKVLLENLLRFEDGVNVTKNDIEALLDWDSKAEPSREISFTPARVVMQDFTGVPAVVDLAAMRDAMNNLGGDPTKINPLSPADLVIDHSVMVDKFGSPNAVDLNAEIEFQRNGERYSFLRWGQNAFENFRVVPPDTGIVHQVNLEYLAPVVFENKQSDKSVVYPDTVVGTDSHTTMINGIGVLGWGVGGIEAEAAMLGQPITMLIPQVVGFKLHGELREGATATDLVLRVVEMLRELGVVGKFVEFFGDGLDAMSLADKATIANMAPEYGATCGFFALDDEAIKYMHLTGREEENIALVEAYAKAQGMFRQTGDAPANYTTVLELDLAEIVPSVAGPKRPQDRINLDDLSTSVEGFIEGLGVGVAQKSSINGEDFELENGDVVIAAITSCTNTSNPGVIMASGLLAQKAAAKGLKRKPWVKTSLAPGSQVVTEYLEEAGLMDSLAELGFDVVGYGCTTCIGNSGPLPEEVGTAIKDGGLTVASVLSGNRNFEGRVHGDVKMNFLASPPLVVAYALAGTTKIDWEKDAIGQDADGNDVFLKDIWPTQQEVNDAVNKNITREMFQEKYADVLKGDKRWQSIKTSDAKIYDWDDNSTYVQNPPYFVGMDMEPEGIKPIENARALAVLGDSITTDHISPAGVIADGTPAAEYLKSKGVNKVDFNSYGSRRGNHEVMMRGTFANIRLRNQMAPGTEGGWTTHQPSGEQMYIYDASVKYQQEGTPLVILAGKEYGTGSSRDWAAKGSALLGARVVIAQSFERIHRSNLVGMGVLPLQFNDGEGHAELGLDGSEIFSVDGLKSGAKSVVVKVEKADGSTSEFSAKVRIDTPKEWEYYENGGILKYVLRHLAAS